MDKPTPNQKARSARKGAGVSAWVSPEVSTALDAVAKAEGVTRAQYICRCIYQDEKIQKLWIEGGKPKLSSVEQFWLARAYQVARAVTLLDSLVMGVEDCHLEGSALDMLCVAEHLFAIRLVLEERFAVPTGRSQP